MQDENNIALLEAKLKRLKISFSKENGKIIIAQATRDYTTLIGLVFFPLFIGISGLLFLIFGDIGGILGNKKILSICIFLFIIGIGNIIRMFTKIKTNKATKVLSYKEIKINDKNSSNRFDANTIKKFEYSVDHIEKETYHGKLFLIDRENQQHLLLGFDGESEQYVTDDLKWLANYFTAHVQLTIPE
ncbi:hypothetical protein [Kordia sp.]|uniref:hypothetical protein n=1 Tax=Kordia sp. TaxID=1965332 RepID=UPI003B59C66C